MSRSITPSDDHVHRDPQGGARVALAAAGLQHVEPTAIDGELEILHVAVVALEQRHHLHQRAWASGSTRASSSSGSPVRAPETTSSP